jgi:hypothetical protein
MQLEHLEFCRKKGRNFFWKYQVYFPTKIPYRSGEYHKSHRIYYVCSYKYLRIKLISFIKFTFQGEHGLFPLYRPITERCVNKLYLLAIKIVSNITKVLEGSADTMAVGLAVQDENTKVYRFNANIYDIYVLSYHLLCRRDLRIFVEFQVHFNNLSI